MELKHVFALIVVFVCTSNFYSTVEAAGSIQSVRFFSDFECNSTGLNEEITLSRDNLTESWLSGALSLHVQGSWRITVYKRESNTTLSGVVIHVAAQAPNGTCIDKTSIISEPDWEEYEFYYANRYGPSDIADSQLILFTESNFYGVRIVVANESIPEIFPEPVVIESFMHFSNQTWIIYQWPDFVGRSQCFCPTKMDDNGNLVIWREDEFFQNRTTKIEVASAKLDKTNECKCLKQ